MREAVFADRAQMAAMSYALGFQRPIMPERQLTRNNAEKVEEFLRRWSADPSWPDPESAQHFRAAFQTRATAHCALEYYRWAFRSIPRADGRRYRHAMMNNAIYSPVLQIHGNADRAVLPRSAQGSNRFVQGPYAWRSVRHVGHFPHEEAPEETLMLILEWLASRDPWDDDRPTQLAIGS
jgi:pimeloyl-ACP methyl ester carboxylesterase